MKGDIFYDAWKNLVEKREGKVVLKLPDYVIKNLEKKQYRVYGHSAVQICNWTKKSIKKQGECYKKIFYDIDCHRCCEFSPSVMYCNENCSFCWRPMEFMKNVEVKKENVDEPKTIIDNILEKRIELLSGFNVNHGADKQKLEEAKTPSHYAISLSGDPTIYPKLPEMTKYLKSLKATKSIFVVTNAQIPTYFEEIKKNKEYLPTQLYISISAPNKILFKKINNSNYEKGWEKLLRSLKIFSTLDTRKVLRFTQLKNINDKDKYLEEYSKLINLAKPDFIEIKAYTHIGDSQKRHSLKDMPSFEEVKEFSKKISEITGFENSQISMKCQIVLLKRKDSKFEIKIEEFENEKNF